MQLHNWSSFGINKLSLLNVNVGRKNDFNQKKVCCLTERIFWYPLNKLSNKCKKCLKYLSKFYALYYCFDLQIRIIKTIWWQIIKYLKIPPRILHTINNQTFSFHKGGFLNHFPKFLNILILKTFYSLLLYLDL